MLQNVDNQRVANSIAYLSVRTFYLKPMLQMDQKIKV